MATKENKPAQAPVVETGTTGVQRGPHYLTPQQFMAVGQQWNQMAEAYRQRELAQLGVTRKELQTAKAAPGVRPETPSAQIVKPIKSAFESLEETPRIFEPVKTAVAELQVTGEIVSEVTREISIRSQERLQEATKLNATAHLNITDAPLIAKKVFQKIWFPKGKQSAKELAANVVEFGIIGTVLAPLPFAWNVTVLTGYPFFRFGGLKMMQRQFAAIQNGGQLPQDITPDDAQAMQLAVDPVQKAFDAKTMQFLSKNPNISPLEAMQEVSEQLSMERIRSTTKLNARDLRQIRKYEEKNKIKLTDEQIFEDMYQQKKAQEKLTGGKPINLKTVFQSLLPTIELLGPRFAYGALAISKLSLIQAVALSFVVAHGWPVFLAGTITAATLGLTYKAFISIGNIFLKHLPEARKEILLKKLGKTKTDLVKEYNQTHPVKL